MATQKLNIEIIAVGTPVFTKTARGGYNSMEVAFKNHSFEGKVEGKKLVDFNDKAVFEAFKSFKQGENVVVTKEKGETDQYWKWVSVEAGSGNSVATESVDKGSDKATVGEESKPRGRVIGNTYETPEERALRRAFEERKHRQIGRQGCLNTAIAFFVQAGPAQPKLSEVIATAQKLEDYVFSHNTVSDISDDIPV